MPEQTKPYRRYKGGRVKGKVPLQRQSAQTPGSAPSPRRRVRPRRVGLWLALVLLFIGVLALAWLGTSYLAFKSGIDEANARVPAGVSTQLTPQDGLLTSTPTTILVVGTDGSERTGRNDDRRSDSLMLVRTDPRKHQLAFLSIPRDLRVDVPGYGAEKINSAFQFGGPTLALRTVKALTGLEVNHVVFVDFDRFEDVIDAVDGIDVDVDKPIVSNSFDCPLDTKAECAQWDGWRFSKGTQPMDGRRALVYSRVRSNQLDPGETDFTRSRRQQQVVQATADKLTSFRTAWKMPFIGDDVVAPLATDLSAGQVLQLGWVYFRADPGRALHCRLGGEPATVDGQSVILGSEDNVATIAMFTGKSAPLPPQKGLTYAPGCIVGNLPSK